MGGGGGVITRCISHGVSIQVREGDYYGASVQVGEDDY